MQYFSFCFVFFWFPWQSLLWVLIWCNKSMQFRWAPTAYAFIKKKTKKNTGCNLKTMVDCALIGVCAVIRSNMVLILKCNWCLKAARVANSVDLDQTPHSVASDLGLLCLLRPVCPNPLQSVTIAVIRILKPWMTWLQCKPTICFDAEI